MVLRHFNVVLLALTLAGCATDYDLKPISRMPDAEYAQLMLAQSKAGVGSIAGKLYFTDRRGQIRVGNNSNMLLWPATPYTEKRERAIRDGIKLPDQMDPRIDSLTRRTHSNSSGEFQFEALPAGAYFLWSVVDMNSLTRRIVVEEGQETTVFLTND
ncbi:carboxypeptidase-like regulatory domain-containing protein [Pseudomonas sp. MM213]|uniref:carboxypeptidase-like regulatory domain-containing protein n=1 Tax=Pseudomonas sp. MM213 TaxID=2866807 RepID=UPI001CF499C4|nr:carboxypeptidase-like regulatory domain-containing protein [Pseudomonas sp. MM213]UCP11418.1 carboxypeptidase-like regulatory domain-containing protein [Pseudomonas sp. MM213]